MDIVKKINSLRLNVIKFRSDRKDYYISPDISTVEIALNLVEFSLKRKRSLLHEEEMWFEASFYLAHGLDGTEWQDIYYDYLDIVSFVKQNNYLRNNIPEIKW
ncbi:MULTISPECIES: hypothetical protein [unclassified Flavobacterium]|uniref:hypothetical protein n=1 Tax=unclassified Flavobacterium TaxID=196869 RepID=UPI00129143F6|nr:MULTISPECIES: hypothetical protein [unclassified Flavobacterium]MQP53238.1 hypothetical protein [Flavobacterium sp. LMO9]MQP63249.1 hypothetical protein [Flavobacterium sp. LMO6]